MRGVAAPGAAAPEAANLNNQLLVGFVVIGLLVGGGYWYMKQRSLAAIQQQVKDKKVEAASLERIIKEVEDFKHRKAALEQRISTINDLKKNQKVPVRVMDRISQDLPDLLWLDKLTLSGAGISIEGRALNPNAVALFTDNLKQDPIFDEPVVNKVELKGANIYSFSMNFHFNYPESTSAEGGAEGGKTAPAGAPGGTPGG